VVFGLAFTSIACLLLDLYGWCPMRVFSWAVFAPALVCLVIVAIVDRMHGDRRLAWAIWIGSVAGLLASVAYDIFRIPFVAAASGSTDLVPALPLFKVFPRFGAMLLGEPLEQASYSAAAHVLGWAYHFSNGMTFGIMYVAMAGAPERRSWGWAVLMAAGLELAMLLTPYPKVFGIVVTPTFVVVTLAAHIIFGVTLGCVALWMARWRMSPSLTR
jgi:hypothetical protein